MPLRLNLGNGYFAELVVAPLNKGLPFAWTAYAPDGRAKRGSAGSTLVAEERAEEALVELMESD